MEAFLRDFYAAFLDTDRSAEKRFFTEQKRIPANEAEALWRGENTVGQVAASKVLFQNLAVAQKMYVDYIGLDLRKAWSRKRKYDHKFERPWEVIEELLDLRHRIAHEAFIDTKLDKITVDRFIFYPETAARSLVEIAHSDLNLRIDLEKHI